MVPFSRVSKDEGLSSLFSMEVFPTVTDQILDFLDIGNLFSLVKAYPELKERVSTYLLRTLSIRDLKPDAIRIFWKGEKNGILMGTSETDELIRPHLPEMVLGDLEAVELDSQGMIMLHKGSILALSSLKFFNPECQDTREMCLNLPEFFQSPSLKFNESVVAIYEPSHVVLATRKNRAFKGRTETASSTQVMAPSCIKVLKDGTNDKMYLLRDDGYLYQIKAPKSDSAKWLFPRGPRRFSHRCEKQVEEVAIDNNRMVLLCRSCMNLCLTSVFSKARRKGKFFWVDSVSRLPRLRGGYLLEMRRGIIILTADNGRIFEMRIAATNNRFRSLDYGEYSQSRLEKILVTDKYILELHKRGTRTSDNGECQLRTQLYLSKRNPETNTIVRSFWSPYLQKGKVEDLRIVAEDILVLAMRMPKIKQDSEKVDTNEKQKIDADQEEDAEQMGLIPFDLSAPNPFRMDPKNILYCDEKMTICRITPDGKGYVMGNAKQILGKTSYWYHKRHFDVQDLCNQL